jgi:hypothetical protein
VTERALSFEEACRKYVHHFTMEHVPVWGLKRPIDSGGTVTWYYAPQYRTDQEWYHNTIFFGEPGFVGSNDGSCYSINQTWPLGRHLDQPFRKEEMK